MYVIIGGTRTTFEKQDKVNTTYFSQNIAEEGNKDAVIDALQVREFFF